MAGVAQSHIHGRFAWQAWHNLTSTFVLRGRRGTHGTGWRAWARLVTRDAAALCMAGVELGDIHLGFTWQASHNLTSTVVLRGRRGTISHPLSFCVAGVALMALGGALGPAWSRVTPRHFVWQSWHLVTSTLVSRGRRGTISHPRSFCVAGAAQSHIHLRLRGRRGTHGTGRRAWARLVVRDAAALCVAGVALGDIDTMVPRGRRGTISHPRSFCVAGVAQSHIHLRFAWQAWHSWHWVARLGPLGRAGSAPAALASLLFDPPEPQIIGKTPCFATFLPFRAPGSSSF